MLLEDLADGKVWPPIGHADRIETQEDYQTLYRNRRDEIISRWSADLGRFGQDQEGFIPYPAGRLAVKALAALLFGEDPTITHPDTAVDDRLRYLADEILLTARLLEGAITQGAQGETYLKVSWDTDLAKVPIVSTVPGRLVVPTFRFGMLESASIVRTFTDPRHSTYWRHVEEHTPGRIRNALWRGRLDSLGVVADLEDRPETRGLEEVEDTGIDEILLTHVPLGRDSESPHGISLFDGLEAVMLGLHRLYSQEQHDAEIARRRIAVSEEYLTRDGAGRHRFDRSSDLFVLSRDAAGTMGKETASSVASPIEFHDDNVMRDRIAGRLRDFLIAVGLNPDTIDSSDAAGAISGTSRKLAQAMSLRTASASGRYWSWAIARTLRVALKVDAVHLGGPVSGAALDVLAQVNLADGLLEDDAELARILSDLDSAEAISTGQKVRRLHPEWTDAQVDEEVAAIDGRIPEIPPAPSFGQTPPADPSGTSDGGGDGQAVE